MSDHQGKHAEHAARRLERLLGLAVIVTIIIAWFLGAARSQSNILPYFQQALPEAVRFDHLSGQSYAAYEDQAGTRLLGYVTTGTANGYGGPLTVAVAVNPEGTIVGTALVSSEETPSYLARVLGNKGLSRLLGKSYGDPFQLGQDVDSITGATYTTRALGESVAQASRDIARNQLGFMVPEPPTLSIRFGLPEITLVALFVLGYVTRAFRGKLTRQIRWVSMIAGLVLLGFVFDQMLTLSLINRFLLGFWPQWQTGLYWYLLLIGVFFSAAFDRKNPYCEWFCPFGAAQECLGAAGGARARTPQRYRALLTWLQRGLAWLAIVIALILHNPGVSSYEVFGTLFALLGSTWQVILLGMVLLAALFIKRPWCQYLCPVRPVVEFVLMLGNWAKVPWKRTHRQPI
jgi:NosR/NirI family transcriptional regulator, nitrous oxide reductase regulator